MKSDTSSKLISFSSTIYETKENDKTICSDIMNLMSVSLQPEHDPT